MYSCTINVTYMGKTNHLHREKGQMTGQRNSLFTPKKNENILLQQEVLLKLLNKAEHTDFGIIHKFNEILQSDNPVKAFQNAVPLTDYTNFHSQWLHKSIDGKDDVVWPGKIKYFAKSSGTSGASSKRLPVSNQMLRQFQKSTYKQILQLRNVDLPKSFYKSKVLVLGGTTRLTRNDFGLFEGDLSGILAKNKSITLSPFSKPGRKIAQLTDWNTKIDQIVEKAPKWNIGVVSGVPSWVQLCLERIIEHHRLKTIHDIWPNFQMYVHGGVFIEPYKEKLESLFGKEVLYQNTYLASEGYFAYQKDMTSVGMDLLVKEGIFYEFVEAKYFDQLRNNDFYKVPTKTIAEVNPQEHYALIISTCSGLWRYMIGDIVSFSDSSISKIEIVGRLTHSLNVCGEHLSETNMVKGIEEASKRIGISIEEFCVYPAKDHDRHHWYIGCNQQVNSNLFSVILNDILSQNNDDYACVRKHLLKMPKVKVLPVEKFYEFMLIKNKFGAQHKFPHVMNNRQAREWEVFLTNTDHFRDLYGREAS